MPQKPVLDAQGLTPLEKRVHSAALGAPDQTLTGEDLTTQLADVPIEEQLLAINGLLKKSLFHAQKGPGGIQYVAISKGEASVMSNMDANELIIYNHIKDAKNEGIWTKLIKARTNLHQTVMTRCLRLLEQKQLVKAVKSVKFPTRKIYMLYGLTPSIELSGGPWYTDNELDTGFIHELSMACLRFIQSKTWPKDGRSSSLYPASHTHNLPTAQSVHRYLKSARLTDTELEPEHVVALLDLLIYDHEIEKVPVLPVHSNAASTRAAADDASDRGRGRSVSRRRRMTVSESESDSSDQAESHRRSVRQDESPSDSDESDMAPRKRVRSRGVKRENRDDDSGSGSDDGAPPRHRGISRVEQDEDEEAESGLTHVPYVYRAVKRMLPEHSSMISTTFVSPEDALSQDCDRCSALDFEEGVVYADPFAPFLSEEPSTVAPAGATAEGP